MAVTLLTMPKDCRDLILYFCLLQHTWVVVQSSNPSAPSVLRTCTQLRKEGAKMFYKENTFILMLETLALPQGHWIHEAANISDKPVITRIREQKEPPGSPQKWLSAFYTGETKIRWVPFRPGSDTRSRHPVVNVLRQGFLIASLLKAQSQEKRGKEGSERDKKRQRSAQLVLEIWCETAKRGRTLESRLRGFEHRELYKKIMESLDAYHHDPSNDLSLKNTRARIILGGAFSIADIMEDDDWQVVQQVLRYWLQTIGRESAVRLCLERKRHGVRRQNSYWLRERKKLTRGERFV